ncbi:MAG: GNAT family N-acetyltransferase [Alphaproteobacteria bacterium]|nr:GNAT family N-acetyltransferase [Alphaproteobacteria bacterium]
MNHSITFRPLKKEDFCLLYQWHNAAHVHAWWDPDTAWTWEAVERKYTDRLISRTGTSRVFAYVYDYGGTPAGYCHFYDTTLFLSPHELKILPPQTAGIDFFLGNPSFLRQGLAKRALSLFIQTIISKLFTHAFVNPAPNNKGAIAFFKKVGFNEIESPQNTQLMIKRIDRDS